MRGGENMNNRERQNEIDGFIAREIYACQSALVEEVLKTQLFSLDDVQNLYRPFDGKLIDPSVCYTCKSEFDALDSEMGQCQECYEANQEPQEIFEWWLVSKWFAGKLIEQGEPVLDNGFGFWWGRCTTGQAIDMDYVIHKMYDEVMSY